MQQRTYNQCGDSFQCHPLGTHNCMGCGKEIDEGRKYCSVECYRNCAVRFRNRLEDRFWKHVDKNGPIPKHMPHLGPCWIWTASTVRGYGSLKYKENNLPEIITAHRFSWKLHYGEIPEGMFVLHHCDVKRCVRDTHLFLGDQQANMTDCARKLRTNIGERNPNATKSELEVLEIKRVFETGKYTKKEISELFRIRRAEVYRIVTGKRWKYLLREPEQLSML